MTVSQIFQRCCQWDHLFRLIYFYTLPSWLKQSHLGKREQKFLDPWTCYSVNCRITKKLVKAEMSIRSKIIQNSPQKSNKNSLYHQFCEGQFLLPVRDTETSKSAILKILGFELQPCVGHKLATELGGVDFSGLPFWSLQEGTRREVPFQ